MKCPRCQGSTIEMQKFNIAGDLVDTYPKCTACGREIRNNENDQRAPPAEPVESPRVERKERAMAKELTEEEKEAKRKYARDWRRKNRGKGSKWYQKRTRGQKAIKAAKDPETRLLPAPLPKVIKKGGLSFLSTAALISPASEIHIELTYALTEAKIIR